MSQSAASLIDIERYPIVGNPGALAEVIKRESCLFREKGVCILPGFLRSESVQQMCAEANELAKQAYSVDLKSEQRPYRGPIDESFPENHPHRRTRIMENKFNVIAYDQFPLDSLIRRLYEWDPLMEFFGGILDYPRIYRFADKLSALNLTTMTKGGIQDWHFDSCDFVVSLALQSSEKGGNFECAPKIRTTTDENYETVSKVITGEDTSIVQAYPMTPGTLMLFAGRFSLHRVSRVEGDTPRHVSLLAYDTKPGTTNPDKAKLNRYGRMG